MSVHILELQDHKLRVRRDGVWLAESPGFASLAGAEPLFGEAARRQFRLHPRQSYSQFWAQLGLEPLASGNPQFRHHADLAYAHLNHLAASANLEGETVFLVPSSYNRNQLAVLLGLVKQTPLQAVGLVDQAVAACAEADAAQALYLDLQLHQAVLTRLTRQDGWLRREAVQQIPGTGLLQLQDAWSATIRDAFIRQSRFDPLRLADTEQFLFDNLMDWLRLSREQNEILLEINYKDRVYQAQLNRGFFEQKARAPLGRLRQEIETLGGGAELYLPAWLSELPGVDLYLPAHAVLADEAAAQNVETRLEQVRGDPAALGFVTALPVTGPSAEPPAAVGGNDPSHILVNARAYPLPANLLLLGRRPETLPSGRGVSFIEVDEPGLEGLITISRGERGYVLEVPPTPALRLNGEPPAGARSLSLGDSIHLVGSALHLQLIQVNKA